MDMLINVKSTSLPQQSVCLHLCTVLQGVPSHHLRGKDHSDRMGLLNVLLKVYCCVHRNLLLVHILKLNQMNSLHTHPVSLIHGVHLLGWFNHNLTFIYNRILLIRHPWIETVAALSNHTYTDSSSYE